MDKCQSCNAVINLKWDKCLVCDSPVDETTPGKRACSALDGYAAPNIEGLPKEHYTFYVLVAFDLLNRGQTISQRIMLQHGPTRDWWERFKEHYNDLLRWRDNGKEEYVGLE